MYEIVVKERTGMLSKVSLNLVNEHSVVDSLLTQWRETLLFQRSVHFHIALKFLEVAKFHKYLDVGTLLTPKCCITK